MKCRPGFRINIGLVLTAGFAIYLFSPQQSVAQGLKERRVLSKSARTTVVSEPETDMKNLGARRLIWESPSMIWRSRKGCKPPFVFIFELASNSKINSLSFINSPNEKRARGISAREVEVDFSVIGPYSGYEQVGIYILKKGTESQDYVIPLTRARWVRLTIQSNYGHPAFTELGEFEAWGKFDFQPAQVLSFFLVILGSAIIVAAFSKHDYFASQLKRPLHESLRQPYFQKPATLGVVLIMVGTVAVLVGHTVRILLLTGLLVTAITAISTYFLKSAPERRRADGCHEK